MFVFLLSLPRFALLSLLRQSVAMAHEGARSSKITYLGTKEKLVSVGFTKQSQRQFKVWDPRNLSKEIKKMDIDQAAGACRNFAWLAVAFVQAEGMLALSSYYCCAYSVTMYDRCRDCAMLHAESVDQHTFTSIRPS